VVHCVSLDRGCWLNSGCSHVINPRSHAFRLFGYWIAARWRITAPQREGELMSIRESIRTGKPYGAQEWIETKARELNLPPQPWAVGRPSNGCY
jgi:hypothetical protein